MSRFVREGTPFAKRAAVEDMFEMAEFCEVFLTARYIKDGRDDEFIPLIQRRRLGEMPKSTMQEVVEEMDAMFKIAIEELEKFGNNPDLFFEKLKSGEYDPVGDFLDLPEMRDALGAVIMRRLRISRGIHDEDEQFEEAVKLMPEVRNLMHSFVMQNVVQAMNALAEEVTQRNMEFSDLSDYVEAVVSMVDDTGIGFSARIKPDAIPLLKEKQTQAKQAEKKKVKFDPAWG